MIVTIITITMRFLEKEVLLYFQQWKDSVKKRQGFDKEQKNMMQMSQATLEGIHITGNLGPRRDFRVASKFYDTGVIKYWAPQITESSKTG